jgi:hypothetical protein
MSIIGDEDDIMSIADAMVPGQLVADVPASETPVALYDASFIASFDVDSPRLLSDASPHLSGSACSAADVFTPDNRPRSASIVSIEGISAEPLLGYSKGEALRRSPRLRACRYLCYGTLSTASFAAAAVGILFGVLIFRGAPPPPPP